MAIVHQDTLWQKYLSGDATFGIGGFGAGDVPIKLIKDDIVFDTAQDSSQFTAHLADFSNYNPVTTAWNGPALSVDGGWMLFNSAVWTQSAGATTNTIYGWFATLGDGNGGQWFGEKFDSPAPMPVGGVLSLLAKFEPGRLQGTSPPEQ